MDDFDYSALFKNAKAATPASVDEVSGLIRTVAQKQMEFTALRSDPTRCMSANEALREAEGACFAAGRMTFIWTK